jgi:hypothetical protein
MPWGHRHGWGHEQTILDRVTFQRKGFVDSMNHAWARRIVSRADSWDCGSIKIVFPAPSTKVKVGDFSWAWFQFKQHITYKAEELGGIVEIIDPEPEPDKKRVLTVS